MCLINLTIVSIIQMEISMKDLKLQPTPEKHIELKRGVIGLPEN